MVPMATYHQVAMMKKEGLETIQPAVVNKCFPLLAYRLQNCSSLDSSIVKNQRKSITY